jgi:putative DNA primase/helicase
MAKVINLPIPATTPSADQQAEAETRHKLALLNWALAVWAAQCVFVATINPPAGGYLKDPTGARRYWPVVCDTIDRDRLERDRDQLWAEAVHLCRAGHPRYLETPELELARAEQDARRIADAWEGPVRSWVGHRRDIGRLESVTEGTLGIAPQDQTPSIQSRVVAILTSLGFTKCRPRTGKGKREHHYTRAPAQKVTTNRDDQ